MLKGVDVFFVVSGFLITKLIHSELSDGSFSLLRFYERRARRILPALCTVVLVAFFTGFWLFLPSQFEALSRSVVATSLFVSNVYFWKSLDYFSFAAEFYPLLHTWSLAVEEQFYIVFPLFLMLLGRAPKKLLLTALGAVCVTSLLLSVYWLKRDSTAAFYLLPMRAWELGLGAYLAVGSPIPLQNRWLRESLATSALLLIALPVSLYSSDTPFPGLAALLPCLGAGLVIYLGAQQGSWVNSLLSSRPLVWFGLISYSLYLWHWPALAFVRSYLLTVELEWPLATAAILFSIVAAALSQRFIEAPFRRRGFLSTALLFGVALSVLATTSMLGLAGWKTNGATFRFDEQTLALVAGKVDVDPRRKSCFGVLPGDALCRIGAQAATPPRFLLWGDSHAAALMPAVSVAAEMAGRTGIFAGTDACPPLVGVWRPQRSNGASCREFNDSVISYLETAAAHVDVVIIAGRWALSATGERAPGEFGSRPLIADDSSTPLSTEHNVVVFERGLERTIRRLTALGKTVVMLGGVPEIGWDVPITLARKRLGFDVGAQPLGMSAFIARNATVQKVVNKLANKLEFKFVPIVDLLCDEVCSVLHEGKPLYVDDDHLSHYGATRLVGPRLAERIWGAR